MTETTAIDNPIVQSSATMLGDLMKCVVDLGKALPKPWQQLCESQQRNWLDTVESQCTAAIEGAIGILASRQFPTAPATVDTVTFKNGGVKASLRIAHATQAAHQIADSAGQQVLIIICDPEEFSDPESKPKPDPDQTSIALDNQETNGHEK